MSPPTARIPFTRAEINLPSRVINRESLIALPQISSDFARRWNSIIGGRGERFARIFWLLQDPKLLLTMLTKYPDREINIFRHRGGLGVVAMPKINMRCETYHMTPPTLFPHSQAVLQRKTCNRGRVRALHFYFPSWSRPSGDDTSPPTIFPSD